jgi:hypothetical protein
LHSEPDANVQPKPNADSYCNRDTHSHRYSNSNSYGDSYTYTYGYSNTDGDTCTKANPNTKASSDTAASPVGLVIGEIVTWGTREATREFPVAAEKLAVVHPTFCQRVEDNAFHPSAAG